MKNLSNKNISEICLSTYNSFKEQSGRSMVEMLGVLAVIGVLSVGGLTGYVYGMDKYRANETTQEISMRMFSAVSQLELSVDAMSKLADEWKLHNTIYPMDLVQDSASYAVKVSNVPYEVCQILFNDLIGTYEIKIGDKRYSETADNVCAEENTLLFYIPNQNPTEEEDTLAPETCGNAVCGMCEACDVDTQTCIVVPKYGSKCIDGTIQGWCVDGQCQPDECKNCTDKEYCGNATTNSSSVRPTPNTCKPLNFNEVVIGKETYLYSEDKLSWWDAEAACKAQKARLAKIEDLIDNYDAVKANTNGYYNGGTLNEAGKVLQEKMTNSAWIWTRNLHTSKGSSYVFGMQLTNNGYVSSGTRTSTRQPICIK